MSENKKKQFIFIGMLGGKQERYIPGLNKQNQVWKNRTPTEFKLIIIANNSHARPLPLMYEATDRPPMFIS